MYEYIIEGMSGTERLYLYVASFLGAESFARLLPT